MSDDSEVTSPSSYRERNSTADRALDVLGLFQPNRLRLSAIDVASELSVARSTAYRYLVTLSGAGYVEEDPQGGFRLGLKVFELARLARASYGLSSIALPELEELSLSTGETALLTRRSGTRTVCLEKSDPPDARLRVSYERGSVLSLNAGASAWVLLAWDDPRAVEALLTAEPLPSFTQATVTDPAKIAELLTKVRRDGYSVTRGELDADAIGIAAPIRDDRGRVVAGISLVATNRRAPEELEGTLVAQVVAAAERISTNLSLTTQ
ncbi:IclR family transcriptional regulator [Naasia lichenicola]|uniref:IclR family transcriptional regulator n=1 Tax=Naasia lichenicola TaxID=2565933 RepID=A0A4S4FPL8_9MICO|nr:IclR family transcriptional regulator [Naasia lichenicola]THG31515.1 IclR family transcriptional regulator [Naasia lichenicola]